ncbi:MAG: DUF6356 family protein [Pseudomonadota bacterium]
MGYFTAHLREVGESYAEHMTHAGWYGWRMLTCGLACLVHAACPWWFQATASKCIRALYSHMAKRGRQPAQALEESVWLEYQI